MLHRYDRNMLPQEVQGKQTPLKVRATDKYWNALGMLTNQCPGFVKLGAVACAIVNSEEITKVCDLWVKIKF